MESWGDARRGGKPGVGDARACDYRPGTEKFPPDGGKQDVGARGVVTLKQVPRSVLLPLACWCLALLPATASAAKARIVRKASPRTGLIVTRDDELMHAVRKKDRGDAVYIAGIITDAERLSRGFGSSRIA